MDLSDISYLREKDHKAIYERCDARHGDVLLVKDGVNTGDAAINTIRGEISLLSSVCLLRPMAEALLPEFLRYFLISPQGSASLTGRMTGTAIRRIILRRIKKTVVPVAPFPEQHSIVDAIESYLTRLDDAVATLERVQRNLKRYRASVLKAAVEGRLVPTEAELAREEGRDYEPASVLLERILEERRRRWMEDVAEKGRAKAEEKATKKGEGWSDKDDADALEAERARAAKKYKEPAAPDIEGLPELPEGWCWATAEALSDETRSITYGVVKLGEVTANGVPTLRSSNVRHLSLETKYVKSISPEIASKYSRTMLKGGELLVTVRGTLGGAVVAPSSCKGFNISREVAMVALVFEAVGPAMAISIASPMLQTWMLRRTKGITYRGINIETLKRLPIPLAPEHEQTRIVQAVEQHLSVAVAVRGTCVSSEKRCERLRQSILKWAFEGKLVDQDPEDEPASIRLERIEAERAKMEESTKKTSKRARRKKAR
jgi:type I restriction enzyme, S subunit